MNKVSIRGPEGQSDDDDNVAMDTDIHKHRCTLLLQAPWGQQQGSAEVRLLNTTRM